MLEKIQTTLLFEIVNNSRHDQTILYISNQKHTILMIQHIPLLRLINYSFPADITYPVPLIEVSLDLVLRQLESRYSIHALR